MALLDSRATSSRSLSIAARNERSEPRYLSLELVAPLVSGATSSRRISIAARIESSGPRYFLRVSMRGWVRAPIHALNVKRSSRPGRALPYRVVNLALYFNHKVPFLRLQERYFSATCLTDQTGGREVPFCSCKRGTLDYLRHPMNLAFGCRD